MANSSSYRNYVLIALSVVAFFNFADRSIFSILTVPIKNELMLSDTKIGLLGGFAFALFYAILGFPLARYADRKNRVKLISVCLAVWSAATAACGMAGGFFTLLIARIGVGAGEAGCFPPSYSLLSDYFPAKKRAFAIGLFHAGGNVGFLFGLMAAGILAHNFGWRTAFFLIGVPGVIFAALFALTIKEPVRGAQDDIRPSEVTEKLGFLSSIQVILSNSAMRHLTIGYTLSIFAFYAALQWLPHFFARMHNMTAAEIGLWYGLMFGGGLIAGVTIGAILSAKLVVKNRCWEMWLPGLGALLSLPCFMLIYVVPDVRAALAFTGLGCAATAMGLGPGFAAIQSLAHPSMRATAAATVLLVSAVLGQGLGPTIVGLISDGLSPQMDQDALRIALSISTLTFAWSAFHYFWGSKKFLSEIT